MALRVVVVGAGPMGLAAAIGAVDRGYEVTVVERGRVGESLRSWGATRFFTPLGMNVPPRFREILGARMPAPDTLLTGQEMAEQILEPLVASDLLRGRVRTGQTVRAIGRRGLTRGDFAGHPLRSERPFRLLLSGAEGESVLEAEIVLDASGGSILPKAIGAGGLPARGELALNGSAIRTLGELHERSPDLRGRRILLVGHGHSAANAIVHFSSLAEQGYGTSVVWAVRTLSRRPCEEIANDPLAERRSVVEQANSLAESPSSWLQIERRAMIESIHRFNGHLDVTLSGGRKIEVDRIAAFTGYRPDGSFLTELTAEVSPVTEGGGRLYRAISNITDCLATPVVRREDLESGEPNFFFVGSRSYGRARTFLLQTGLAQLETILDILPR